MKARLHVHGTGTPDQRCFVRVSSDDEDVPAIDLTLAQAQAVADLVTGLTHAVFGKYPYPDTPPDSSKPL